MIKFRGGRLFCCAWCSDMFIGHKSGVAADTSGHQLAEQFVMCASLTFPKENFMYFSTTPVTRKMNKFCVLKLFELQGFQKLPPLSKEVKRATHKMNKVCFFWICKLLFTKWAAYKMSKVCFFEDFNAFKSMSLSSFSPSKRL